MTFAAKLNRFKEARAWSLAALTDHLSQKVGRKISRRTVENWLQGRKPPHSLWLNALEEALKEQ